MTTGSPWTRPAIPPPATSAGEFIPFQSPRDSAVGDEREGSEAGILATEGKALRCGGAALWRYLEVEPVP